MLQSEIRVAVRTSYFRSVFFAILGEGLYAGVVFNCVAILTLKTGLIVVVVKALVYFLISVHGVALVLREIHVLITLIAVRGGLVDDAPADTVGVRNAQRAVRVGVIAGNTLETRIRVDFLLNAADDFQGPGLALEIGFVQIKGIVALLAVE